MILRNEKRYCFLIQALQICSNKEIFPRRYEIDKFFVDIEVYKIANLLSNTQASCKTVLIVQ